MLLQDKRCPITGAGTDIGQARARLFAREGTRVAVVDIHPASGQAAAEEILGQGHEACWSRPT